MSIAATCYKRNSQMQTDGELDRKSQQSVRDWLIWLATIMFIFCFLMFVDAYILGLHNMVKRINGPPHDLARAVR